MEVIEINYRSPRKSVYVDASISTESEKLKALYPEFSDDPPNHCEMNLWYADEKMEALKHYAHRTKKRSGSAFGKEEARRLRLKQEANRL